MKLNKTKTYKILSIIFTSLTVIIFVASLIYAFLFFSAYEGYRNPNDGNNMGAGFGISVALILYIIHAAINLPFSILGIIFGANTKKYNKKTGIVCLVTSICCLVISIIIFIIMLILI